MDVQIGHFQVIDVSVSKPVLEQNLSNENEFELHENEPAGGNTFSYMYSMNRFTQRIVLTQRQKAMQKWPTETAYVYLRTHCSVYLWSKINWKQVTLHNTCIQSLLDQKKISDCTTGII